MKTHFAALAFALICSLAITTVQPTQALPAHEPTLASPHAAQPTSTPVTFTAARSATTPDAASVSAAASTASVVAPAASAAQPRILPIVAAILGVIARFGIKHAIKVYGKTSLKKALRQKLMSANANRWNHIMQGHHKWSKFNAQGNRDKIADLLTNAVANGRQTPRGSGATQHTWVHQGKTIVAVVSKHTGEISDGWVK